MTAFRPVAVLSLCCLASVASAGKYNKVLSIGDKAPAWTKLPGTDDSEHSTSDLKDKSIVVVAFTCNSCPYSVDYEDRLIAFTNKHAGPNSDVAVVAINVNLIADDSPEKMKERAEAKKFPFPYLFDETQQIAKDFGALYTPEFYVLDKDRKVVYMGALDDKTDPTDATVNYLELAVAAARDGKLPEVTETGARGCLIRIKRTRRRKPTE